MTKVWHVCISGFSQSLTEPTGLEALWGKLRHRMPPNDNRVIVTPREWDDDMEAMARFIVRNGDGLLNVYAYSWGAGHGFLKFANACQSYGLQIRRVVLADPVYASKLWSFSWRALTNKFLPPKIKVPTNVHLVRYYRQRTTKPAGHEVVAVAKDATRVVFRGWLDLPHTRMDDSLDFHAASLTAAGETENEAAFWREANASADSN